ncbi:hypothetical protein [Aquipseudomonas alcaligenes]|uniref:Uncharacterized protein n=1 Tax=Aquipseudomonas alcaligenes TaxID=43263 RepID=A0A1N6WN24_AQUAC|nr:hypothetical protein [Pseudomonas alcaligenes]SIQ91422.1 hypothetical protein SAMN05878282_11079 [Pseudomonas alcaligenes]
MNKQNEKQHFTSPKLFNKAELEALKKSAENKILSGYFDGFGWKYPAADLFSYTSYESLLAGVIQLTKEGREQFLDVVLRMPSHSYYEVMFFKPKAEIEKLISEAHKKAEEDYLAELEADKAEKTALLAKQLYEQNLAKERKAQEQKEHKAKEQAVKEAEEYVASLMKDNK